MKKMKNKNKFIALYVMGKPKKVLFNKQHILAIINNYGETHLELINQDKPIILRDSVDEVEYLMGS